MILYGLKFKSTGQLLRFETHDCSDGEFCGENYEEMTSVVGRLWTCESAAEAEKRRTIGNSWFNGANNPFPPDDLEVVELQLVDVKLSKHRQAWTGHVSGWREYRDACQDCSLPWSEHKL